MKKLFIGLLIIAAGAAVFFYFLRKQTGNAPAPENKELKQDSTGSKPDSAITKKDSSTILLQKAE